MAKDDEKTEKIDIKDLKSKKNEKKKDKFHLKSMEIVKFIINYQGPKDYGFEDQIRGLVELEQGTLAGEFEYNSGDFSVKAVVNDNMHFTIIKNSLDVLAKQANIKLDISGYHSID